MIRTEFCDDKKRIDVPEVYLTAEREPASIITDHGKDFEFEEGSKMKI